MTFVFDFPILTGLFLFGILIAAFAGGLLCTTTSLSLSVMMGTTFVVGAIPLIMVPDRTLAQAVCGAVVLVLMLVFFRKVYNITRPPLGWRKVFLTIYAISISLGILGLWLISAHGATVATFRGWLVFALCCAAAEIGGLFFTNQADPKTHYDQHNELT